MRRMSPKTKRIVAGIIAALLALIMIAGMFAPMFASDSSSAPGSSAAISVEGTIGVGNVYKVGGITPVNLTVTNNGAAFEGEVQILMKYREYNYFTGTNSDVFVVTHSYPIELPPNGSKRVSMDIEFRDVNKNVKVEVVDKNGKKIADYSISATPVPDLAPLAGVFSTSFDELNYVRTFEFPDATSDPYSTQVWSSTITPTKYAELGKKLVEFNADNMPDRIETLASYNYLIINDYDTGQLSKEQLLLIKEWVNAGGILIVGTGHNFEKVMKGINGTIIDIKKNGLSMVNDVSALNGIETAYFGEDVLEVVDFDLHNGIDYAVSLNNEKLPVISYENIGLGKVYVFGYDLAEKGKAFNTELYNIFRNILTSASTYNLNVPQMYVDLNSLPILNGAALNVFLVVVIVYAIFIGPVLYAFLKSRDKRQFSWIVIPSFAIVMLIIMSVTSYFVSYRNPFMNTGSFLEMKAGQNAANAFVKIAVMSPQKGDVEVALDEPAVLNVSLDSYRYGSPVMSQTLSSGREIEKYKIIYGNKPKYIARDVASWEMQSFETKKLVTFDGTIETSLFIEGEDVKGTITNNTGSDLEDLVVSFGNNFQTIGNVANGETVDIGFSYASTPIVYGYYQGHGGINFYAIEDTLFTHKDTDTREEKRIKDLKRSIFSYASNNANADLFVNPTIYCFIRDDVFNNAVTVNGKTPIVTNLNLVACSAEFDSTKMQNVLLPYGLITPKEAYSVTNGYSYEVYGNAIYLSIPDEYRFVYNFGNMEVSKFKFDFVSTVSSAEYIKILNNETGELENLSTSVYEANASDYINENGEITLVIKTIMDSELFIPFVQADVSGFTTGQN